MFSKRKLKKWLIGLGILFGLFIVLATGFHFWFKTHARKMLEDMVETRSNGKLKLKLEKFHFNYFTKKMRLEKAVFYSDSTDQTSAYSFIIEKIELKAKAILPIVFRKEFLIDSINLRSPEITVTRLRPGIKTDKKRQEDVSIPEEMGKIYRSIQDAMKLLKIQKFQIHDGTFTLINRIDTSQLPLSISHIDFQIDDFQVDEKATGTDRILFSDNVILNSKNQDILFPDGRHRLSFSRFNINLKKKLVVFDSCTIAATKGDSSLASFDVFFDALQLTNIDFDTLYKSEVIKADSVHCLNPSFNLEVEVGKRKGIAAPPKLENIIKQLTGDLLLAHVVVTNAAFNIKTLRNGVPSSFTFSNNNFEMQGLKVDQESVKPVSVESFSMAIRNYENFIKDSLYSVRFDSVVFKDDRITLSHFLFNKLDRGRVVNTFSIPQFNLSGLSWDDLVFENKLTADQAIMFNPYINYTASANMGKKGGLTVFQSLGALNEYMDLKQLDIIDGTIDLKLKNKLRLQLDNATLSVKSHSLLESRKLAAIRSSLLFLRFKKGIIHAGDFDLEINDIDYNGNSGGFMAGNIQVVKKNIRTILEGVEVGKLIVDEKNGNLFAESVTWKKADVRTDAFGGGESQSSVVLKSVRGSNTRITGPINGKFVSARLDKLYFSELNKTPGQKFKLEGLAVAGNQLVFRDEKINLEVSGFDITDGTSSRLNQVKFKSPNAYLSLPSVSVVPHISDLLDGKLSLGAVTASRPRIQIHVPNKTSPIENNGSALPPISISSLRLNQPNLDYTIDKDSVSISLQWQGEKNPGAFAEITNLVSKGRETMAGLLRFHLTDFVYSDTKGKTFTTGDGKLSASIKNIRFETVPNAQAEWQANINQIEAKDFRMDSIGKQKRNFELKSGQLENLDISSSLILNLQKLVAANSTFRFHQLTGNYSDLVSKYTWANMSFNRHNNSLHADSISIHPLLSRDSFIARQKFEVDYMDYSFGEINAGPIDIAKFIADKSFRAGTFSADRFSLIDYRDKRLPNLPGVTKELPVNLLKNLTQKIHIDTLRISNSSIEYTEVSEKTGMAGTVPIKRLDAVMTDVKNYDIKPTDSLGIIATGYLLDTAWIKLTLKESYTDTLASFLMTVDMSPVDARVFNAVLVPLEGVRIESGFVDTVTMWAIGREHLSLGEMNLLYRDLDVRFLPAPGQKNTFLIKLKNFVANTFVVKDKNDSKTGIVFFIRDRERSAINYIVKIAMSGISSSVGAASNKKLVRKYKKLLESKHLSPIDFGKKGKPF